MMQDTDPSRLGRVPLVLTETTLGPLQDTGRRCQCSLRQLLFISLAHALGQRSAARGRGEGLTLTDLSEAAAARTSAARLRLASTRTGNGAFLYERRRRPGPVAGVNTAAFALKASAPRGKNYDLVARATEYDAVLLLEFFFEPAVVAPHRAGGWLVAYAEELERLTRTLV